MQIFRSQELVFQEFEKLESAEPILNLMKQGKEPLAPEFFLYILRHILAKQVGEGVELKIKKDKNYSRDFLKKQFLSLGFKVESLVYEPGQVSFRGDIIEFWDQVSLYPIRLEFFDTQLEAIYFYDLKTKKRIENLKEIFVYPLKFKEAKEKTILDLPIENHFKANLLQVSKLAKQKNQIIFIFSKYETALRDLTQEHKAKLIILPSVNFPGFSYKNIHLFTDADFEKKIPRRQFAKIVEFGVGDFVVHIDHGICKLEGIGPKSLPLSLDEQIIGAAERKDFYYHLRFRNNAFLYAHLSEKNRITKYIGASPKLSALGGREWQEIKILATLEAKRLAKKLAQLFLDLQRQKIIFNQDEIATVLEILEQTFPFDLTRSQQKALSQVEKLLQKEKPIDHLIAGEASSGKTEVALRIAAMFLANNQQVLFLAPTTFLAYQNFLVAESRLSNLRIKVGVLSRFNTVEQNAKNIHLYNQGKIQMLVGTHKILFSNLSLKKTGLMIIDEEQRFGVEQKEQMRLKKPDLSMLYLSATPIPRTLNLALTGVKTISVLHDMPFERGEIKSAVLDQDDFKQMKKFINWELKSKGQVYFVAPLIRDLHIIEQELIKIGIKNAVVAHGRMHEKKLAQVFSDFSLGKIKILLSTAIVEHGLDFSNANTMILWFGERLGMADLYQLRGRVGRSAKNAQFVLAIPKTISDASYSRLIDFLNLIKEPNAFYQLSLKDLEKRGSGDIFGKRQHGVINKVGLYMFSDLVKKELG